jgi:hypothetical protein
MAFHELMLVSGVIVGFALILAGGRYLGCYVRKRRQFGD